MPLHNYSLLESYEWYGSFSFVNPNEGRASGILSYEPLKGPTAEILFDKHYSWLDISKSFSGGFEKHDVIYANLVDKKTNSVCFVSLINCSLQCLQMGSAPPRYKIFPSFVLLSNSSYLELENEKLDYADVEFNTWPEFNFPQNQKNKKKFDRNEKYFKIQDQLSISQREDIKGYPLYNFSAFETFVGPENYLQQINDKVKPIVEKAKKAAKGHTDHIYLKSADTHNWYLKFKKTSAEASALKDYTNAAINFSHLLMLLTHDWKTAVSNFKLSVVNADKSKSQYSLLFWGRFPQKKPHYNHHNNGLKITDFSDSTWKRVVKKFYSEYTQIDDYIQILFENNYEDKFTYFHFSRIIDCISALSSKKGFRTRTKYQDAVNEHLNSALVQYLIDVLEPIQGNNIGEKISNLRASIVHFGVSEKPDIHIAYKLYPLLELIVIDYIFEVISLPKKLRNKYKNHYSQFYLNSRD